MTKPRTNSLKQYPTRRDGSLLHYPEPTYTGTETIQPTWLPNDPFHATLRLTGMESGRSAKYVMWAAVSEVDTRTWPMFVADLLDLLRYGSVSGGVASGRWQVRKRGANYGLARAVDQ